MSASADSFTADSLCVYANTSLPFSPTTVISTTNNGVRSAMSVPPFHVVLPSLQTCGTAVLEAAPSERSPLAADASFSALLMFSPPSPSPSPSSFSPPASSPPFPLSLPELVPLRGADEGSRRALGVGGLAAVPSPWGGFSPNGRTGILRIALLEETILTSWTQARSKNLTFKT